MLATRDDWMKAATRMLTEALCQDNIAICVKDTEQRVLEQNAVCRGICGDRRGASCDEGCVQLYARDNGHQWKRWGSRLYRNERIQGEFFDVILLCGDRHIISFLQPLKEKYDLALAHYASQGLTGRETEIVSMAIRGVSNAVICRRLGISRATLRTHLNNVYRKLRETGDEPEFLPAKRLRG